MMITLTLTPEQEKQLEAEVAAGRFASVEAAVRFAVDHFMPPDMSDLSWAKPYIDVARAQIERGETVTLEEFNGSRNITRSLLGAGE
jgi:Arc/MetJ-type ribon-helix-helix transcriptional regulator